MEAACVLDDWYWKVDIGRILVSGNSSLDVSLTNICKFISVNLWFCNHFINVFGWPLNINFCKKNSVYVPPWFPILCYFLPIFLLVLLLFFQPYCTYWFICYFVLLSMFFYLNWWSKWVIFKGFYFGGFYSPR